MTVEETAEIKAFLRAMPKSIEVIVQFDGEIWIHPVSTDESLTRIIAHPRIHTMGTVKP